MNLRLCGIKAVDTTISECKGKIDTITGQIKTLQDQIKTNHGEIQVAKTKKENST
jgi:hypothetical protein